jgi:hypothetical protein
LNGKLVKTSTTSGVPIDTTSASTPEMGNAVISPIVVHPVMRASSRQFGSDGVEQEEETEDCDRVRIVEIAVEEEPERCNEEW